MTFILHTLYIISLTSSIMGHLLTCYNRNLQEKIGVNNYQSQTESISG